MASEFPHVEKSFIHGLYEFDVVLSALWLKAGELTDELHDILNNHIDLETLDLKQKNISPQLSTSYQELENYSIPKQTTSSPEVGKNLPIVQDSSKNKKITFSSESESLYIANQKRVYAGFCAIFLGVFGIHKFILGYNKEGIIMLCVTLFSGGSLASIVGIVGIVEGIIYLTKSEKEFLKIYINSKKAWF
ncbi:hypothetical protein CK510_05030 [Brunnivagina elsteri CCALA 953]|uniref:TM2 domain-containing protein n=2 Tax=Brunnivagina TaxID=3344733 RepID=A0A2A2TN13_9CYAN|nr:hypothetical protein CK510_05030 [Calothrix elsteri CCALA 953]